MTLAAVGGEQEEQYHQSLWNLGFSANMPEYATLCCFNTAVLELSQRVAGEAVDSQRSASSSERPRLLLLLQSQGWCRSSSATGQGSSKSSRTRRRRRRRKSKSGSRGGSSNSRRRRRTPESSKVSPAISRSGRSRKNCASSRPRGSAQAQSRHGSHTLLHPPLVCRTMLGSQRKLLASVLPKPGSRPCCRVTELPLVLARARSTGSTTRLRRAVAEGVVQTTAVSGLANDACIPAGS